MHLKNTITCTKDLKEYRKQASSTSNCRKNLYKISNVSRVNLCSFFSFPVFYFKKGEAKFKMMQIINQNYFLVIRKRKQNEAINNRVNNNSKTKGQQKKNCMSK